jgi:hypothetical protein
MNPDLLVKLAEILGIPIVVAAILTIIKVATGAQEFKPEMGADVGMDLAMVAAGACGGIFANATLVAKWGGGLTVYGILTVLLCILSVAWLSYVRRFQGTGGKTVTNRMAALNVATGAAPIGLVASVLILGFIS